MKRICLSIIVSTLFISSFTFQVTGIYAKNNNHDDDNEGEEVHITSPITPPITHPITSFAHMIHGHVTYRFWRRFGRSFNRIIPADDVVIKVKKFFGNQTYSTNTDSNGDYQITVPDGLYKVQPSSPQTSFFTPPFRFVNSGNNGAVANFQGFLFSF